MSADRVRFIEGISNELKKLGCKKVEKLDEYNSLWLTDSGVLISVPDFGDEDRCPEAMWFDVLADIARTRNPR